MVAFLSIRKLVLIAALVFSGAWVSAQGRVELTLGESRVLAQQALLAGDYAFARDLANGLLQADPNDRLALIILAVALPRLEDAEGGRRAGAWAFRLSRTSGQKYEAARITALAAANQNRLTAAQYWLRRAAISAPDISALEQTRRDFQTVRSQNPLQVTFGFHLAPSNNVNGGSSGQYNIIDGLPIYGVLSGDAQALPGVVVDLGLTFSRSIGESGEHRTALFGKLDARRVFLNDTARAISPDSSNADFGGSSAELGLTQQWRIGQQVAKVSLSIGTQWFGGDKDYDFARFSTGFSGALTDKLHYQVSLAAKQEFAGEPAAPDAFEKSLSTQLQYRLGTGGTLSGTLTSLDTSAANVNDQFQQLGLSFGYRPARQIGPVTLDFSIGGTFSDYPNYWLIFEVPGGRQDRQLYGALKMTFPDSQYAGFVPQITLSASDTQSNVSRFDRNTFSVGLGLVSSF